MEKIEGIELSAELSAAEADILGEQRRKVRALIGGVVSDIANWKREREQLQKQIDKLGQKIFAAEEKYAKIKAGDWSVLNDNMAKQQPTPEK